MENLEHLRPEYREQMERVRRIENAKRFINAILYRARLKERNEQDPQHSLKPNDINKINIAD